MMRDMRLYMLVGGLPQTVDTYLANNNFQTVDEIKREIISLYNDEICKIDSHGRTSRLFSIFRIGDRYLL